MLGKKNCITRGVEKKKFSPKPNQNQKPKPKVSRLCCKEKEIQGNQVL